MSIPEIQLRAACTRQRMPISLIARLLKAPTTIEYGGSLDTQTRISCARAGSVAKTSSKTKSPWLKFPWAKDASSCSAFGHNIEAKPGGHFRSFGTPSTWRHGRDFRLERNCPGCLVSLKCKRGRLRSGTWRGMSVPPLPGPVARCYFQVVRPESLPKNYSSQQK